MLVSMIYTFPCPTCGHIEHGAMVRQVVVNKHSIRTKTGDIGLGFIPRECRECKGPLAGQPDRMDFAPEDQVRINDWRTKRGWGPLPFAREPAEEQACQA